MATNSKNIWWDKSITLVEGCTPISVGCEHCWSAGIAHRFRKTPGLTHKGSFVGKIVCREDRLNEMRRRKKPTRWTIWNDLFHEKAPFEFIDKVFARIVNSQHTYLVLTKRIERAQRYFLCPETRCKRIFDIADKLGLCEWACDMATGIVANAMYTPPFDNVHLGVTVCNQDEEDKILHLIQTPAAVRFISVEPMLGPLEIEGCFPQYDYRQTYEFHRALSGNSDPFPQKIKDGINGVICGCESGPNRRPTNIDWIRSLRDQCEEAGIPFFLKQMVIKGEEVKMPELDGKVWAELPGAKQ